tara:strand:- start:504 stop:761 length:258 start_codon:yes stop_codon:yes gene_type:complete
MELEQYINVVRGRYNELTDEEQTIVEDAADSPIGDVMRKLFGPEMSSVFGEEEQEQPMSQPQPMADQMQSPPPMGDQMQGAGLDT